jgi:hypothetical protein
LKSLIYFFRVVILIAVVVNISNDLENIVLVFVCSENVLTFPSRFFLYLFPPEPEFEVSEVGLPLHLTPYIKANRIPEARDRALVRGLQWPGLVSYAGFLTVNQGKG